MAKKAEDLLGREADKSLGSALRPGNRRKTSPLTPRKNYLDTSDNALDSERSEAAGLGTPSLPSQAPQKILQLDDHRTQGSPEEPTPEREPSNTDDAPSEPQRAHRTQDMSRYHVFMTREMKTSLNQLGDELQDRKAKAKRHAQRPNLTTERITGNTVSRAMLSVVLKHFDVQDGDMVDSEDELVELFERRLKKKFTGK